jgi:mRNA-degrading endonuclease toxin of MazEF toxin-antitoxin module
VSEKLLRMKRTRLAEESAKLETVLVRWSLALKTGDLPKHSWAKISQIRILSTERLGKLIGRLSREELAQVIEGLNEIIA